MFKIARPGIMLIGLIVFIVVACMNAPENNEAAKNGEELKTKTAVKEHNFDLAKKTSYALNTEK